MNLEEIKELIRVFGRSKLGKLKVKDSEFEISMVKEGSEVAVSTAGVQAAAPVAQVATPTAATPSVESAAKVEEQGGDFITSPMVGTFYTAPSPDSPAFASAGDTIKKGQTICILEAMKIMNEYEAEFDCKIVEVLVQDGEPVEYDMPLFKVEKL